MLAYLDSSCIVALALGERGAAALRRRTDKFERLVSAALLEAEVMAALRREGIEERPAHLDVIDLVHPERSLAAEIASVLATGCVRGADCWHLATALHRTDDPRQLMFLTLDAQQRVAAERLGFGMQRVLLRVLHGRTGRRGTRRRSAPPLCPADPPSGPDQRISSAAALPVAHHAPVPRRPAAAPTGASCGTRATRRSAPARCTRRARRAAEPPPWCPSHR